MNIIDAESIITSSWTQFFQRGLIKDAWNSNLGLFFHVEISIENFGYERDGNTHHPEWARQFFRSLQFVVTASHQVFLLKSDGIILSHEEADLSKGQWQNTSNHDSCWREDGLREIWESLHEGYKFCWDHVPDEHKQTMNSMGRHCSVNTGVFSKGLIQFVRVETESDPDNHGWRRMTSLKKVGFQVNVDQAETEKEAAHV